MFPMPTLVFERGAVERQLRGSCRCTGCARSSTACPRAQNWCGRGWWRKASKNWATRLGCGTATTGAAWWRRATRWSGWMW